MSVDEKEAAAWFQLAPQDGFIFSNTLLRDAVVRTSENTQRILLGNVKDVQALLTLDGENLYVNDKVHTASLFASDIAPEDNVLTINGNKVSFTNSITEFANSVNFLGGVNVKSLFVNGSLLLDSEGKLQVKNVIRDGAIGTNKLIDGIINNDKIAIGAIETDSYSNESITGEKIDSYTLPGRVFMDKSVTNRTLEDNSLENRHFSSECIDARVLASYSVDTDALVNSCVTSQKLTSNLLLRGVTNISGSLNVPDLTVFNKASIGGTELGMENGNFFIDSSVDIKGPLSFTGNLKKDGIIWNPTQWNSIQEGISYGAGDVLIDKNLKISSNLELNGSLKLGQTSLFGNENGGITLTDGAFNISSGFLALGNEIIMASDTRTLQNIRALYVDEVLSVEKELIGVEKARLLSDTFMFNKYHMHVSSQGVQGGIGSIQTRYYRMAILRSLAEINNFGCLTITGDLSGGTTYETTGSVHVTIANRNGSENQLVSDFVTTTVWGGEPAQIASGVDLQLYEDNDTGRLFIFLKTNLNSTYNLTFRGGDIISNNGLEYNWKNTVTNEIRPNKQLGQTSLRLVCSLIDFPSCTHYPFGSAEVQFKSPVQFREPVRLGTSNLTISDTLDIREGVNDYTSYLSGNAVMKNGWVSAVDSQKSLQIRMDRDNGLFSFYGTPNTGQPAGTGLQFGKPWCSVSEEGLVAPLSCGVTTFDKKYFKVNSTPNSVSIYGYSATFSNLSYTNAHWITLATCSSCERALLDIEGSVIYEDLGSADFQGQMHLDRSSPAAKNRVSLIITSADVRTNPLMGTFDITAGFSQTGSLTVYLKSSANKELNVIFKYISLITDQFNNDVRAGNVEQVDIRHYDDYIGPALSRPDIYLVRDLQTGFVGYNTFTPKNNIEVAGEKGSIGASLFNVTSNYELKVNENDNLILNERSIFDQQGYLITDSAIPNTSLEYDKLTLQAHVDLWNQIRGDMAVSDDVSVKKIRIGSTALLQGEEEQSSLYLAVNNSTLPFALTTEGSINMLGENTKIYKNGNPWVTSPWNSNLDPNYIYYDSNVHIGGSFRGLSAESLTDDFKIFAQRDLLLQADQSLLIDTPFVENVDRRRFFNPSQLHMFNMDMIETRELKTSQDLYVNGNLHLGPNSSLLLGNESTNVYLNLWKRVEGEINGEITAFYGEGDVEMTRNLKLAADAKLFLADRYFSAPSNTNNVILNSEKGLQASRYTFEEGSSFVTNGSNLGLNTDTSITTFQVNGNLGVADGEIITSERDIVNVSSIRGDLCKFHVQRDGKVGIQNINPIHTLTVNGTIGLEGESGLLYASNDGLYLKGGSGDVTVQDTLHVSEDLFTGRLIEAPDIKCTSSLVSPFIDTSTIVNQNGEYVQIEGFFLGGERLRDVDDTFSLSKNGSRFKNLDVNGLLSARYMDPVIMGPPDATNMEIILTAPVDGSITRSTDKESDGYNTLKEMIDLRGAVCVSDAQNIDNLYLVAMKNEGNKTFANLAYQPIDEDVPPMHSYQTVTLDAYGIDGDRDKQSFMGDMRVIAPNGIETVGPYFHSKVKARSWDSNTYNQSYIEIGTNGSNTRLQANGPMSISATDGEISVMDIDRNIFIPGAVEFGMNILSEGGMKQVYADNNGNLTTSVSDQSAKENIRPAFPSSDVLDTIDKLNPVRFTWKNTKDEDVGLIAQEVLQIYPESVGTSQSGRYFVNYDKFTPLLIKGLQDAMARIKELEKIIHKNN